MQYSPKLKRIAAQIKKILKDNDVAGLVVLHTPGNSEYVTEITPSYAALKWRPKMDGIDVLGKAAHYGNDKAKRDKAVADTANMLDLLSITSGNQVIMIMELAELVKKTWGDDHGPTDHTSDTQQNN